MAAGGLIVNCGNIPSFRLLLKAVYTTSTLLLYPSNNFYIQYISIPLKSPFDSASINVNLLSGKIRNQFLSANKLPVVTIRDICNLPTEQIF